MRMPLELLRNRLHYVHIITLSFHITFKILFRQSCINKALIIMSNTSLLNPGPENKVSVVYQNVQGLIQFSSLADRCPNLDVTKIAEFQSYISLNKPDIIILNESWLIRN